MEKTTAVIIDDVAESRDLLKKTLRNFNCVCVKECSSGRGAIQIVKDYKPDFVFLDIHMPKYPGLEVLRDLQREDIHANVWIVSGEPKHKYITEVQSLNASGYIEKPFKSIEIKRILEKYHNKTDKRFKLTALVVDDDETMRKLLRKQLFSTGKFLETVEATCAEDVISRFEEKKFTDISFIDIEMSAISGLELLKYIKLNNIPTYPIIISAHSNFENVKQAIDEGSKAFLVKPFNIEKIQEVIEGYIEFKT